MMQGLFRQPTHLPAEVSFSCCVLMAVALGCTSDVTAGSRPGLSHLNLFACGIDLSCDQIYLHAFDPLEPRRCAARLLISNQTGALSKLDDPGPHLDEVEDIIFFLGDGTVLVQSRERHCGGPGDPPCPVQWEPLSAHRRCKVTIPPGLEQACAPDCMVDCTSCLWIPTWSECENVEDWSCQDVLTALGNCIAMPYDGGVSCP